MAKEDEPGEGQLEWSAFYDDEGRIYYYNSVSGESSWEAPEKFNPPEEVPPEASAVTTTTTSAPSAWVAYQDDEGRTYYFNTESEETTWDKPEGFAETPIDEGASVADRAEAGPEDEQDGGVSPVLAASPEPNTEEELGPADMGVNDAAADEHEREPDHKEEEQIDPALKRLQEARNALEQTDAIMEPGVLAHVTEVVTSEGGKPLTAIEALSESYFGQTAACGLMSRWLADLRSQSSSTDPAEQASAFRSAADEIRDMVQDVINRFATERFTKTGGDKILNLSKAEAAFLQKMMVSSRWRKLLIDLSASNKESALLMYCLEQISKQGHHREIARRINQSDHFTVFHAMLASELSVMGKIAVSACKGQDTSIPLMDLVGDLKRTCTSTAYTYLYAVECLRQLVATSKEKVSQDPKYQTPIFARAIRKWERLNEELQSSIIDPTAATTTNATPLFRKRRLDVAITISELHQRRKRRLLPSKNTDDDGVRKKEADPRARTENAVLEFLRRYSLGTRVDDRILDKMLPEGLAGDASNLVGKLMIKRPLTVKALLAYLYNPASQRISSPTIKNKCARLISMSVQAAQEEALAEAKKVDSSSTIEHDEVELTRNLLEGSRLCEALENMVSFLVSTPEGLSNGGGEPSTESPGQQLCQLAMKCAPVAQGVAIWAREVTKGNEFVSSASYPTLSPSILSLMRIIFLRHPFTRDDTMDVAMCFLTHSNSEISYQKLNSIKEQSMRLLLFLCTRGEAPMVLGEFTRLVSGTAHLDASLIRYFVSGLLQVAAAPFSIPFVRLLCRLLKAPAASEAIKTSYFDDDSKKLLNRVIRYMGGLESNGTQGKLSLEDSSLVKSVIDLYGS